MEKESLWNKVISSIHNLGMRSAYDLSNKSTTGVRNNVARMKVVLAKRDNPISTIIKRKVNSGDDTLFQKDEWIGDKPLQLVFPDLYCKESHKKCKISDQIYDGGLSWSWSSQPDTHHVNQLRQILRSTCLNSSSDSWSCELDSNGQFSVAACRSRLKLDRMVIPFCG